MTFQLLGADIPYAPSRDYVYITPHLLEMIAEQLNARSFRPLNEALDSLNVNEDQLVEGMQCLCRMLNETLVDPEDTQQQVWQRSGWAEQPAGVRMALYYWLGAYTMHYMFGALRETTSLDEAPRPEVMRLLQTANEMATYMEAPRWQRRWWRVVRWFRRRSLPVFRVRNEPRQSRAAFIQAIAQARAEHAAKQPPASDAEGQQRHA